MKNQRTWIAAGILLVGLACVGLASAPAYAGKTTSFPSSVSLNGNQAVAHGIVRATRESSNSVEYIGCEVAIHRDGSESAWCFAKDPEGDSMGCSVAANKSWMIHAINSINDQSRINLWAVDGECEEIRVWKGSMY